MTSTASSTQTNWRFAASLAVIGALGPSAVDMYLASLPEIAHEYARSYTQVQLTLTVFLLAMGAGQLLFGPVVDTLGRRRPLLAGLLVFILSSLLAAAAPSLEWLLLARFVQGLGSALTLVVIMSMVRDVAQGARAAQIFALLMTIEGLAPVIAPALGGFLSAHFGWRAIMLVLAGLGMAVLLNSYVALQETLAPEKRLAWRPSAIVRTYVHIAGDSAFLRPTLAAAAVFFFLFAYIGGAAFAYQTYFGLSASSFGYVFGTTGIAILLGAICAGRLVARLGLSTLARLGAGCMLLGAVLTLYFAVSGPHLSGVVAGIALSLFGLGLCESTLMALAMASQERALGSTAALLGALQLMISSSATPLAGAAVERGVVQWTLLLLAAALVVWGLTWWATHNVAAAASTPMAGH